MRRSELTIGGPGGVEANLSNFAAASDRSLSQTMLYRSIPTVSVSRELHRDAFGDARANHVTDGGPSEVVRDASRTASGPTSVLPRIAGHFDRCGESAIRTVPRGSQRRIGTWPRFDVGSSRCVPHWSVIAMNN